MRHIQMQHGENHGLKMHSAAESHLVIYRKPSLRGNSWNHSQRSAYKFQCSMRPCKLQSLADSLNVGLVYGLVQHFQRVFCGNLEFCEGNTRVPWGNGRSVV